MAKAETLLMLGPLLIRKEVRQYVDAGYTLCFYGLLPAETQPMTPDPDC